MKTDTDWELLVRLDEVMRELHDRGATPQITLLGKDRKWFDLAGQMHASEIRTIVGESVGLFRVHFIRDVPWYFTVHEGEE